MNLSKKTILLIIAGLALILALIVMYSPKEENVLNADANPASLIKESEVKIISFNADKNLFGKWIISGEIANNSNQEIESIEFKASFSDNKEFIEYSKTIPAKTEAHSFEFKVTGHKGKELKALSISSVKTSE